MRRASGDGGARPLAVSPSVWGHEGSGADALRTSGLLDTPPEGGFDDVGGLAYRLCAARFAMVGLVGARRTGRTPRSRWFLP